MGDIFVLDEQIETAAGGRQAFPFTVEAPRLPEDASVDVAYAVIGAAVHVTIRAVFGTEEV